MNSLISLLGLLVILIIALLLSSNRKKLNLRLILSGLGLQFLFGVIILRTGPGQAFFEYARYLVAKIMSFSDEGAKFLFGEGFQEHFVAFSVLSTIIFISSLTAVLFHLGVIQVVVKIMARSMVWIMDVSGAESLAASANVFMGHTESPLLIKPYLNTMTRSELMAMMSGGMATVSGGMMAAYAGMGADAGHLLAASIMSAPASLVLAKIITPETEVSPTKGHVKIEVDKQDANLLDAACRGASDGLKLALNVGAMLIAFIALVTMANWMMGALPHFGGEALTLQRVLGWICAPLAWLMGVPWEEAPAIGSLLGEKTILNEFYAYKNLTAMKETISPRSFNIATYALCGFANFGSIAIQIGGIGVLAPKRRADFARLGLLSMVSGTLAAYMTACIASLLM